MTVSRSRPPGWYTDGADPTRQRWWDGGEWSHVTRADPDAPPPVEREAASAPPARPGYGAPAGYGQPGYGQPGWGAPSGYAGWRVAGPTTPDGVPLAEPGLRLLARIMDYLLTTVVGGIVSVPFWGPALVDAQSRIDAFTASRSTNTDELIRIYTDLATDRRLYGYVIASLAVSALYTVLMLRFKGATLGKMAVGVRVRSWDHEGRLTWSQVVGRWVTREALSLLSIVGMIYLLVDSLWCLGDPKRQALHDKLPGTVVVRAR